MNNHYSHSSLVRFWRANQTENLFGIGWSEGETHTLQTPFNGYEVSVSFTTYSDHPEHICIRSTNWRCEYEPRGIYSTDDARAFYKTLLHSGFIKR